MEELIPTKMEELADRHLKGLGTLDFYVEQGGVTELIEFSISGSEEGGVAFERFGEILKEFPDKTLGDISAWPEMIRECRETMGRRSKAKIWVKLPSELRADGYQFKVEKYFDYFM